METEQGEALDDLFTHPEVEHTATSISVRARGLFDERHPNRVVWLLPYLLMSLLLVLPIGFSMLGVLGFLFTVKPLVGGVTTIGVAAMGALLFGGLGMALWMAPARRLLTVTEHHVEVAGRSLRRVDGLSVVGVPGKSLTLFAWHKGRANKLLQQDIRLEGPWTLADFESLVVRIGYLLSLTVHFPRRAEWHEWRSNPESRWKWALEARGDSYAEGHKTQTVLPARPPQVVSDLDGLHWPGVARVDCRTLRVAMPLGWKTFELDEVRDVRAFFDVRSGVRSGWLTVLTETGVYECSELQTDEVAACGLLWLCDEVRAGIATAKSSASGPVPERLSELLRGGVATQ